MPLPIIPYMSVTEMAVRLNVCAETVRREYRKGRLKGIKVGQQIRFSEDNFLEYVKAQAPVQVPLRGNEELKR